MPTAYTQKILSGEISNFKDFAKLCTRAFLIQMRDESFDAPYKKREPTDYHIKAIELAQKKLKDIKTQSDKEIIDARRQELLKSKEWHLKNIKETGDAREKLEGILWDAEAYKPPTDNHNGIKDFIIEQLKGTIKFDGDPEYSINEIKRINKQLKNIDKHVDAIRSEIKVQCTKDIAYHTEQHEAELKRCKESNQWYDDFINSLEG